jgi:branched-chain amino acid transport system ATP-binding protein
VTNAIEATDVSGGYGPVEVVHNLSLTVKRGEVVALLGPNGAGKSTVLRLLSGVIEMSGGQVKIDGEVVKSPLHQRARKGLGYVSGEKPVFSKLTVEENLRVSGVEKKRALELFPELEERWRLLAGSLSGGEQQMLALTKTLGRGVRILMADELSLGLAPIIVDRLLNVIRRAADEDGVAVLTVEQHVSKVMKIADRGYVMRRGRIETEGSKAEIVDGLGKIADTYLAGSEER